MARPKNPRCVSAEPATTYFKPRGMPMNALEEVVIDLDEFEAIRLADLLGHYQQQGAEEMGVSRQTFARVLDSGRRKVADAIVNGKALRIEGLEPSADARYCPRCRKVWVHPSRNQASSCPSCGDEVEASRTPPATGAEGSTAPEPAAGTPWRGTGRGRCRERRRQGRQPG